MLDHTLLFGLLLGWTLLGLATLPRGPGWPLWLVALAQFALLLTALFPVFIRAEPLVVAPIFGILWFALAVGGALLCRNSAMLVAQQFTLAAACAPLLLYSLHAERLMPRAADAERTTVLVVLSVLLVAASLIQATIGLYSVALWVSPHRGGTAEQATAPKAKHRARRRKMPQPARSAQYLSAENHVKRLVESVNPSVVQSGHEDFPGAILLVSLILILPFGLLHLGAWLAFRIAGRNGADDVSLAAPLRTTAVALILHVSIAALVYGLVGRVA